MVTSIRRTSINKSQCPVDRGCDCWTETDRFSIKVSCDEWKGSPTVTYLHVYNLGEGEELLVEREYSDNCDPMWAPLRCQGCVITLTDKNPDIMLVVPGKYLFRTRSGETFDSDDFAVETSAVHFQFADLWLKQQSLCCCVQGNSNE